jgi:hypothetical protein
MQENCGTTNIPIGSKVKIIANYEGNMCEPFLDQNGIATHPFKNGCCKSGWIGVILEKESIYGRKFNFHIDEISLTNF